MRRPAFGKFPLPALALAVGCASPAPCLPTVAASSGNDQGAPTVDDASGPAPAPSAPAGFVEARVEGVLPTPQGNALLLSDPGRTRIVPVMIGEAEAMVIDLRLQGQPFERPLTHDLLDSIVRALGGTVVAVQVDKLRTGVFIGTVLVWDGSTMHRIDSRTSDAVAVALGHRAPIYVSTGVFDEAGIDPGEVPSP